MPYLLGFHAIHFWNPWSILINPVLVLLMLFEILFKIASALCEYACTKLSVKPMNKTELLIKFSAFHSEINYSNGDKISERFFFKAFLVHSLYP